MYKKIDSSNKIFSSNEFLKDKYKFYIVVQILNSENPIIYSNEEDYFFIRSDNNHPAWIWTKDDIDIQLIDEIKEVMKLFLVNDYKDKFTCKKEFYQLLMKKELNTLNKNDYFEMGSLSCKETKQPRMCSGTMVKAELSDLGVLTKNWYQDNIETGDKNITIETAELDVLNLIKRGNFYIFKDVNNKIVCMAAYTINDDMARINHVYTPLEERCKGYCANLIYHLTNKLLEEGITPMLYTNYNYIASNKSYVNAGYVSEGILISFTCTKEK